MTGQSWPRHLPTGLSQLGACGHSQSRYRRSQVSWHKPETWRFMLQSPWERRWRSLLERIILAHWSKESNVFHRQIKYNTGFYEQNLWLRSLARTRDILWRRGWEGFISPSHKQGDSTHEAFWRTQKPPPLLTYPTAHWKQIRFVIHQDLASWRHSSQLQPNELRDSSSLRLNETAAPVC